MDRIDLAILRLLERRVNLAASILARKRGAGWPARDPVREREILDRLCARSAGALPPAEIRALFRRVLLAVRRSTGDRSLRAKPGKRETRPPARHS